MNPQRGGAVRELVRALLLAVLGVRVDGRRAERLTPKSESLQPEVLDLLLAFDVVREQVAGEPDAAVFDLEVIP
jgi:hypothetical protein